ncbi:hypothetical protein [Jiulongibacter sp. NS-SX5]|uniref:hypothetical protein n=1 Tax=Jiulongibacter sp. NS-SX5 TaxID=3463854 RepID=UPI004057FC92
MRFKIAYVRILTILYLAFPLIPFYLGWLKPVYAGLCLLLLFLSFYFFVRKQDLTEVEVVSRRFIFVGGLILLFWLMFSGVGGFGYQFHDHVKNNTLAKELSNLSWPISYNVDGETMYLSHYLSFYIVGPATGGILGYKYAQLVLFIYTYLGLVFGVFWFGRALKQYNWKLVPFLILFGGISLFSFFIKFGGGAFTEILTRVKEHGYVFWMNSFDVIPLNFMGVTDMLYWTPQHFLPALIGVGLCLNAALVEKSTGYLPYALSLLAMWSPMILAGLFPVFALVVLSTRFRGMWSVTNLIIAPILFLVNASFLLAIDSEELVKNFIFQPQSEAGYSLLHQVVVYFYFLLMEVLLWFVLLFYAKRKNWSVASKQFIYLSLGALILIPLYRFGLWNDWCNRVSVPYLLILAFFAFKTFLDLKPRWKPAFYVILALGSMGALMDIVGSARSSGFVPTFKPPVEGQVQTLPEICVSYPITQFVASEETFFFKYLAKTK